MALITTGASGSRCDIAAWTPLVPPYCVGGWIKKSETVAAARNIWSQGTAGQDNERWSIEQSSGLSMRASARTTGTDSSQGAVLNDNTTYHHVLANYLSASSRQMWVDGVPATINTATRAPAGANYMIFGRSPISGTEVFAGRYSYWCLWQGIVMAQADLDNLVIDLLAPRFVQTANVVSSYPFLTNAHDSISGFDLTETGVTFDSDDAPGIVTTLPTGATWQQYRPTRPNVNL